MSYYQSILDKIFKGKDIKVQFTSTTGDTGTRFVTESAQDIKDRLNYEYPTNKAKDSMDSSANPLHEYNLSNYCESLPVGSIIIGTQFEVSHKDTIYERTNFLIDYNISIEEAEKLNISNERTLTIVIKYKEGFKGNLFYSGKRVK